MHGFDDGAVFEGCMPVEVMARRGEDTLRYGPLKPVGLRDPRTGRDNYAVVQLRRDNAEGTLYNIVGFQTHLTFGEQKRVFSMIPGSAERGVRALRRHAPQHLFKFPAAARPVLPPPESAAHPLRRTDDRC
ncbi:MAG: FAD-dependent oxidoreductase [Oscillospiraceae bacterium]